MTTRVLTFPDAQRLSWLDWTALVKEAFGGIVPDPGFEEHWREWACALKYEPQFGDIPSPFGFDNWREWAYRLTDY